MTKNNSKDHEEDEEEFREGADPEEDEYEEDPVEGGSITEEHLSGSGRRRRSRKRIKIRKRVRIKRKSSPKKKAKKMLELAAWVLIITVFIVAAVYLIVNLDLNSKHREKKSVKTEILPHLRIW